MINEICKDRNYGLKELPELLITIFNKTISLLELYRELTLINIELNNNRG
ncbi:hypothetical protein QE390_000116 [Siphonobacter sp. SORGH_AS 1065]|nr:hypothetical protein [Siphonobacter sp. SORGH_AS_1065]